MLTPLHCDAGQPQTLVPVANSFERELMLSEVLYVLRRRKLVILAGALVGLLIAAGYVLIRAPRYEARAQIEVSPAGTNGLGLDELAAKALNPNDSAVRLQAAVQVLQSNSLALEVIDQLGLAQTRDFAGKWQQPRTASPQAWSPIVRDRLLEKFRKALRVEVVPKTDVVAISFSTRSPSLSATTVNAIVQKFRERTLRSSYDSASEVSDWLSKQLEDLKNKARRSQEQLAAMERTSGLLGQDETDNIVFAKLKQLDEELTGLESDRIVKEARYRIASAGDPELLATSAPDATLQLLRSQQAGLRMQYAQLSSKYGSGYPKLKELADQIAKADAAVDHELKQLSLRYRNDYQSALRSEQMLRARFEAQKQKAYRLNEDATQHAILRREVESTQQLYETLQLKLKQAGIAAGLASANIEVIDPAQVPSEPAGPKPLPTALIGVAAGVVLGMASAVVLESDDDSVRSPEEAERTVALPTLGTIPKLGYPARLGRQERLSSPEERVVMLRQPSSRAAEAYRLLCNSLLLACDGAPVKVVAVTSATALEGKTTTAINCAIALAQQGSKVLLVDADLRQPCIHECFGLSQQPGLVDHFATPSSAVQVSESAQQPGLHVLTAGAPDAACVTSREMKLMPSLLEQWRRKYDHVVIDTPPVSLVSDAVLLAACSDAVLLVVRSEVTSQRVLRRTCGALQRASPRHRYCAEWSAPGSLVCLRISRQARWTFGGCLLWKSSALITWRGMEALLC